MALDSRGHRCTRRASALVCIGITIATLPLAAQKKKKGDDMTQTLELPKDPPMVSAGETRKLVFQVSPLSGKGLLSQQTKDAVRAILKLNGNAQIVHVRAFVAGNGDVRRVPQIISDVMSEKHLQLPSVSVVRVGGLTLENAQVVLETVSVARKDVNPAGLDFVDSGTNTAAEPATNPRPLLDQALEQLLGKSPAAETLAVTCFVSTMTDPAGLVGAVTSRYSGAAVNVVMTQRGPFQAFASCQAVRRGTRVTAARLAFTGTRVAFGQQEKDATLAFQRLDRDLTEAGSTPASVVFTNIYPLSGSMAQLAGKLRASSGPVAMIPSEGVAAIEAGFAVDAIATVAK
ncbi:MAG TPA: hypothetical protein VNH18_01995 [Bryobacteraceae bacterium]|nr:hypothetical protein [Bryobacteraceae bacterium]